jgi:hypothetical protein
MEAETTEYAFAFESDFNCRNSFLQAAAASDLHRLQVLFRNFPPREISRITAVDGESPIHLLLKSSDNVQVLSFLVETCQITCGGSSFEYAVKHDRPDSMDYLISRLHLKPHLSHYMLALRSGSFHCVRHTFFRAFNLTQMYQHKPMLEYAILSKSLQLLEELIVRKGGERAMIQCLDDLQNPDVKVLGTQMLVSQLSWRARRTVLFVTKRKPLFPKVPKGLELVIISFL